MDDQRQILRLGNGNLGPEGFFLPLDIRRVGLVEIQARLPDSHHSLVAGGQVGDLFGQIGLPLARLQRVQPHRQKYFRILVGNRLQLGEFCWCYTRMHQTPDPRLTPALGHLGQIRGKIGVVEVDVSIHQRSSR